MLKHAKDVNMDDKVDLQCDEFADPNNDNVQLQYEYQIVCYIERETPNCIAIGFEGFDIVGFPPHHLLRVQS